MTYVVTRLCRDCIDAACVDVCPCDCIVQHVPQGRPSELPNQLFIDPDVCIDCGMCTPECPWEAIVPDDELPAPFRDDLRINAIAAERPDEFQVPLTRLRSSPTPDEVAKNRARWLPPPPSRQPPDP